MRVMGIDPGSVVIGWGVVSDEGPNQLRHIVSGFAKAPAGWGMNRRLKFLHDEMGEVIGHHGENIIVIENAFVGKYASAALALGHARGMIMGLCFNRQIRVTGYAPAVIKRAVAGTGGANKDLVARMVTGLLQMETGPANYDEADALAAAICHLNHVNEQALIAGARE